MDSKAPTKRQQQVLNILQRFTEQHGFGPSVRDIAAAMDIASPNGVVAHLQALERKGCIRRTDRLSRSIQLTRAVQKKLPRGLPLVGDVAAGALSEAIEQNDRLDLDRLFVKSGNFALRIKGDSMIEAQIANGDYVIVKKQSTANRGQIVVAITPDDEATVKYYFPEKKRVRLQPANKKMKPIFVDEVSIVGVVVGVVRSLKQGK